MTRISKLKSISLLSLISLIIIAGCYGSLAIPEHLGDAQAALETGRLYLQYRDLIKAKEKFRFVISEYKDATLEVTWAHYELGYTHYRMTEFKDASAEFTWVISHNYVPAATALSKKLADKIQKGITFRNGTFDK